MNRRFAVGAALGVAGQLSASSLLLASAWLLSRAAEQPPVLYLMVAIVGVRFFGISRGLLRYAERLATHDAAFAMVTNARVRVYGVLERLAPALLTGRRRGDLISRVVADVDSLHDRLLRIRLPWIVAAATAGALVGLVGWIDLHAGAILAGEALLAMVVLRLVGPKAGARGDHELARLRGDLAAEVSQLSLSAAELVAHGAAGAVLEKVTRLDGALAAVQRRSTWVGGAASAFVLLATGLCSALIASVTDVGAVPAVMVAVLVLAPIALVEPLEALAEAERLRPDVAGAQRRIRVLADIEPLSVGPDDPDPLPAGSGLAAHGLAVGWDSEVAEGICFDLPEGHVVGVAGPSGSGKSTLALTLVGLVPPRAGEVRLGGADTRELSGHDLRRRIGMLGQDAHVFDTDLRQNLRIADPRAGDEELVSALERAGLADLLRRLPRGLDTMVGEHGSELSGGERQRLGLARLLLGEHRILVLDEPTEHLDEDVADALVDDLLALAGPYSLVVISHADRVLERLDTVVTLGGAAGAPPRLYA